jgi:protein-L-isoaspartate(D-aspartate) O-methyltransferase
MDPYSKEREMMVKQQIEGRGIHDPAVLAAMRSVPRHRFVPEEAQAYAYSDKPLRIPSGQTISQPYIVALMTDLLNLSGDEKVLDVGTGSGYQAAVLAELADFVHSIERHPELAEQAEARLKTLGYENVRVHVGDGSEGYAPAAPYDCILVAAAAPEVPQPLLDQLAPDGRLVVPVGSRFSQRLEVWDRKDEGYQKSSDIPVVFVPLIGKEGWEG